MNRMRLLHTAVLMVSSTLVLTNIPATGQNFAYVANGQDNTVSVISTTSDTVVQTIPVANSPFGVAITPNGKFAYVSSQSGVLTVIDTATNSVVQTFLIGGAPFVLAQPEMEKRRSPLVSIPPFGRGFSRHEGLSIR